MAGMAFLTNLGGLFFKTFRGSMPPDPLKIFSPRCAPRISQIPTFVELYIFLRIITAVARLAIVNQFTAYQGEIKARVISLKSIPQPLHK